MAGEVVAAGGGGGDDVGKKVCALFHRNGSSFGNKLYCRKNPVIEGALKGGKTLLCLCMG